MKVIDFGLARKIDDGDLAKTMAGTPMYVAPEVLTSAGHNLTVDWWTVGIILFEMAFGVVPFYEKSR